MTRTFAIGDLHGCLEELELLLNQISYVPARDRLIFLGDLVDRGPNPAGVIRFIRELQRHGNVDAIKGNHDEKLCRWYRREHEQETLGKKNMMRQPHPHRLAQWEQTTEEDRSWLDTLPLTVETETWIAVHGGFEAVPMEKQKPEKIMRVRYLDPEKGTMVKIGEGPMEAMLQPEGSVFWSQRWEGPKNVVYGHTVHSFDSPRVDRASTGAECWGIDTGVCYGGHLTALLLETKEVTQVKAKKPYHYLVMSDTV